MKGDFEKAHSDIKVNMVRLSSGETYAKIRAEARNPKTDIWWAGTGDPHLQAASENLTLEYKSPMLDQLQDWAKKQAESSGYKTVGVYAGALGWGYNTEIFKAKGFKEPKCWADLLDPAFKGEIQIANPNSSGTAYTALASLVQIMGEDQAYDYLKKLNANISQYTKSGSAPVKAAARGETAIGIVFMHDAVAQTAEGFPVKSVAPCEGTGYEIGSMSIVKGAKNLDNAKTWYDWALKPDVQSRMKDAKSFQLPSNKTAEIPKGSTALRGHQADRLRLQDLWRPGQAQGTARALGSRNQRQRQLRETGRAGAIVATACQSFSPAGDRATLHRLRRGLRPLLIPYFAS